jgi:hypothetical protein
LELVAKKGTRIAEHFAHCGGKACAGVRETNAHAWAKKILEQMKRLWIPAGTATAGRATATVFKARLFKFDRARLEKREGMIVPDVMLTAGDRELIVEIRVTHACDDRKIAKIRAMGKSALEIDLSNHRTADCEKLVAAALIGTDPLMRAPRHWLFNTIVDDASLHLAADIRRREAEGEMRRAKAAADRKAALGKEAHRIVAAARSTRPVSTEATLDDLHWVNAYGLGNLVKLESEGSGFRVPSKLWQCAIVTRILLEVMNETNGTWPTITPQLAGKVIADCLVTGVPFEPEAELKQALQGLEPAFKFPVDAIAEYLGHLKRLNVLEREHVWAGKPPAPLFVGWRLRRAVTMQLRARKGVLVEQERRKERADDALSVILALVPKDEQKDFSAERWRTRSIPGLDGRLADLIETGDERWRKLVRALDEITRMLRDGPPCSDSLGLPVEPARERAALRERLAREAAEEAKQKAEAVAAKNREYSLSMRAMQVLGTTYREEWLSTPSSEGPSFIECARASADGFHVACQALAETERQLHERRLRDREAANCRAKLKSAAARQYDPARTELFLHTTQPRLSMSPWARCTNEVGLNACLALLPKRRR